LAVRYLRLPTLFEQLLVAHGDGSYPRLMNQLLKMDLVILDDWGIQKITPFENSFGIRRPL
jgi:DNA replication protein DnaC